MCACLLLLLLLVCLSSFPEESRSRDDDDDGNGGLVNPEKRLIHGSIGHILGDSLLSDDVRS